jgi:hypothetical protein
MDAKMATHWDDWKVLMMAMKLEYSRDSLWVMNWEHYLEYERVRMWE